MGFCPQCGAPLGQGARYCEACGSALALPTLPAGAAPPVSARAARDTGAAQALLLLGAALGVLLPLLASLAMAIVGGVLAAWVPWGAIPGAALAGAAFAFLVLSLVWAVAVLHARNLLAQGRVHDGAVLAMVAGLLMLLLGLPMLVLPALAGLVVLAGGALAWQAK